MYHRLFHPFASLFLALRRNHSDHSSNPLDLGPAQLAAWAFATSHEPSGNTALASSCVTGASIGVQRFASQ